MRDIEMLIGYILLYPLTFDQNCAEPACPTNWGHRNGNLKVSGATT